MKKKLQNFSNFLSTIFLILIICLSFISLTNKTVTNNYVNELNAQIEFNKNNKEQFVVVDGVKLDGTKLTPEEIAQRENIEAQIKDIDIFTPKIIEFSKSININLTTVYIFIICSISILILFQFGIFKSIGKIFSGLLIASLLNIGFIFNLSRYISMPVLNNICSTQIMIAGISFIISTIAFSINNILKSKKIAKEDIKTDKKIQERVDNQKQKEEKILKDNSNNPVFIIASTENSTVTTTKRDLSGQSEEDNEELQNLKRTAYVDPLTKLYNRAAFEKDRKEVKPINTGIIMLDVNNLKKTNDTFGHKEGDKLICYAADYIRMMFEKFGKCYRLGGDEFVVLVTDTENEEKIQEAIINLNPMLEKNNKLAFPIIVALGYAKFDDKLDKNLDNTLSRADELMYQNKKELKKSQDNSIFTKSDNTISNEVQEEKVPEQIIETSSIETSEEIQPIQEEKIEENIENESENIQKDPLKNLKIEDEDEDEIMHIAMNKKEFEEKLRQKEQEIINREEEKHQKALQEIKEQQLRKEQEMKEVLEREKKIIEDEKQKQLEQQKKLQEEREKIEKNKKDLTSNAPIVERVVQRIDGSVEKLEDDGTVMGNYESLRNYLDKKENKNPYFIEDKKVEKKDLKFADYNPEDSPYFKNPNIINNTSQTHISSITLDNNEVDNDDA